LFTLGAGLYVFQKRDMYCRPTGASFWAGDNVYKTNQVSPGIIKQINSWTDAALSVYRFTDTAVVITLTYASLPKISISGGDLSGNFSLFQFHFHWGSSKIAGSEHTVDGAQYPAEVFVIRITIGLLILLFLHSNIYIIKS